MAFVTLSPFMVDLFTYMIMDGKILTTCQRILHLGKIVRPQQCSKMPTSRIDLQLMKIS